MLEKGSLLGLIQFRLGCYEDFVCFIGFVHDSSVQVLSFVKGFQYGFYTAEGNARRRTDSVTTPEHPSLVETTQVFGVTHYPKS